MTLHVDGTAAIPPTLAELVLPAPELLDALAAEYAPVGEAWDEAFWAGFHLWVVDRIEADVFDGTLSCDLREAMWALWSTGYWVGVELNKAYGIPDALRNMGMDWTVPDDMSVADTVAKIRERQDVLERGGAALFDYVPTMLREEPCTGALHGSVYNAAVIALWTGAPPIGERPDRFEVRLGGPVRVNPRDFSNYDYPIPVPSYVNVARARWEGAVRAHPDAYEAMLGGIGGDKDLRDLWQEAFAMAHQNWGTNVNSLDEWTQGYFDAQVYWGAVLNFSLEAVSLTAMQAVLDRDEDAARRAITGNLLHLAVWGPAVLSLIDPSGAVPTLVEA